MTVFIENGFLLHDKAKISEGFFRPAIKDDEKLKRAKKVLLLNLMSTRKQSEEDFVRLLDRVSEKTGFYFHVFFAVPKTHQVKDDPEMVKKYYLQLDQAQRSRYDLLIVTGAPVDKIPFSKIDYWEEFQQLIDWQKKQVNKSFFSCWAAAGLAKAQKNIEVKKLDKKVFGIFNLSKNRLGIDLAPHSRWFSIDSKSAEASRWQVLSGREDPFGVSLAESDDGHSLIYTGHFEYRADTLAKEYYRDVKKGLKQSPPENYFLDRQKNIWLSNGAEIIANWLEKD